MHYQEKQNRFRNQAAGFSFWTTIYHYYPLSTAQSWEIFYFPFLLWFYMFGFVLCLFFYLNWFREID